MQRRRIIMLSLMLALALVADAQHVLRGLVTDSETHEPIIGATIADGRKGKPLAVTGADGRFQIPNNNYDRLKISYVGYKTLVTAPAKDGRYQLQAEISTIGEVVVTAQESRGLATASKIEKHAMEHLQPSSFTDILELLPGGRAQNPSLTARLHKAWEHEAYHLGLSTNADYTGSFDNDKEDPDLNNQAEDAYSSQYNRMALMAALELKMKRQLWLKSVNVTLSAAYEHDHHPRMAPVTQEVIDRADYDRIFQIYQESFSDASNFKAVIIGHITLDELRPLLCQYLATLPSTGKHAQTNWNNVPRIVGGESTHIFRKPMATPLANVSIYYTADVPFTPQSDLELDFLKRCLSIAYTDSVREEKGGTYGVSVDFDLDRDEQPNATLKISYNADPNRYQELNPIIYQQLKNIAEQGPAAASMDKVKQYLVKQYAQLAIDDGYWDYVIWHELDDDADFDINYCQMVEQMTPQQVQQMARRMLEAGAASR